jgi:hypothetical protein
MSDGKTNFGRVKKVLNFRSHPDVQTGRRF